MAIRPVDMQVMLQRAPEVNRLTNNDGSRAETQNSQFANEFQRAAEQEQKQVIQTQNAEGRDVDKDGKGPGQDAKQRRNRPSSKKGSADEEKNKAAAGQGMLDIRI